MTWELIDLKNSKEIGCTMDNSGIYTVINRIDETVHCKGHSMGKVFIRVDVMTTNDEPLRSFVGDGNNVRKNAMNWLWDKYSCDSEPNEDGGFTGDITIEHASYIGFEISRAMLDKHYKQD